MRCCISSLSCADERLDIKTENRQLVVQVPQVGPCPRCTQAHPRLRGSRRVRGLDRPRDRRVSRLDANPVLSYGHGRHAELIVVESRSVYRSPFAGDQDIAIKDQASGRNLRGGALPNEPI